MRADGSTTRGAARAPGSSLAGSGPAEKLARLPFLEATDFRRGGDQLAKPNFEYQKRQKELEKKKKKEEKLQRKLEKKNAPGDASPPEAPAEPAPAAREIP